MRPTPMRVLLILFTLLTSLSAQQLPHDDDVRIAEGIRLSHKIQDKIWSGWGKAPFGILLVTNDGEFLVNHPKQPEGFTKAGHSELIGSDVYVRPRKFPLNFQATFPALGDGIPVIVIGQPANTESKTSTPWVITLMHEHFHQLQYSRPDYQAKVAKLGLAKGDTTGMWMINYPFPYEAKSDGFKKLKMLLLAALNDEGKKDFKKSASVYLEERGKFLRSLTPDDLAYFGFQIWQEGMARYTQIKAAEAAAHYEPTQEYKNLANYESFADYAKHARSDTDKELNRADMASWQRVVFYSYGASEGLFLDRWDPTWKDRYFLQEFSPYFYRGFKE